MALTSLRCNLVVFGALCRIIAQGSDQSPDGRDWTPFVLEMNGISLWIQLTFRRTYGKSTSSKISSCVALSFFKMLRMRWLLLGSLSLVLYAGIGHSDAPACCVNWHQQPRLGNTISSPDECYVCDRLDIILLRILCESMHFYPIPCQQRSLFTRHRLIQEQHGLATPQW